ncbi:AbrB/MazE/SpoVT family DNA-binding domain-containing protein [Propylenella binzhouense]|uniref:AbrB/MazE/SpoVT family DNA-binding domain-containing protein n=1 Tax=Propylenella binzhouense TaxID=2555902 RepID=A0A964T480_9HYPH|nr:AbrB/MazE/SpoVT family DNA-binding domain-containing protein [Propylenella binzhouense]MYZ48133.1 AbrB/MazE/SpoVT family DNA-binding domain-containing protein [Propylenella binzhouense]
MRLTEKSQVTVPKRVREKLGIGPGSEVDFVLGDDGVRLVKVEPALEGETKGQRLVRLLREAGQKYRKSGLSADEIMDLTRGPFDDVDPR